MPAVAASNRKALHSDLEVVCTLLCHLASLLGPLNLLLPCSFLLAEGARLVLEFGLAIRNGGIAILAPLDQDAVLLLQTFKLEAE